MKVMDTLKNSCGIWVFKSGYQDKTILELTKHVVEGLDWMIDGFEYHYPFEVNEENFQDVLTALNGKDIYTIGLGTFADPRNDKGAFINPSAELRKENLQITKRAIDLASHLKARLVIWPGREGYCYTFQADYADLWKLFIDGLAETVDYANQMKVPVLLEHSDSRPPMKLLMRNIGMTIYVIRKISGLGVDTANLKVNMDWQHLIMNGECLAEYAALLAEENLLGHQHANAGWGRYNDFHIAGSSFIMQTLELAYVLQDVGYGQNGERIGFDIVPFSEDPIEAVKRSILQWEFLYKLAGKIDRKALAEARFTRNASHGLSIVYQYFGLDQDFIENLRKEKTNRVLK
jgi:xylose isomerase